jgi:hypothetical protein
LFVLWENHLTPQDIPAGEKLVKEFSPNEGDDDFEKVETLGFDRLERI